MVSYLWKGISPAGVASAERVSAENASAARQSLESLGWKNLVLLEDEIAALAAEGARKDCDPEFEAELTVEEEAKFALGVYPGFFRSWAVHLWESKISSLIIITLVSWGLTSDRIWPLVIAGLMLAFFPAIYLFISLPGKYYSRLNKAKVWYRWDEVAEYANKLERLVKWTHVGIGSLELARVRAQVLAAKGRVKEGVRLFEDATRNDNLPEWASCSHLSGIYDHAQQYEKSLELRRKAAAAAPDNAAMWIDVAFGAVKYLPHVEEAKVALAKAEQLEVPALGKGYLPFLRGIIHWREGSPAAAREQFQEAMGHFEELAHLDMMEGMIYLTEGHLCAVEAASGEKARARKRFKKVENFLIATKETELLEACRKGLAV